MKLTEENSDHRPGVRSAPHFNHSPKAEEISPRDRLTQVFGWIGVAGMVAVAMAYKGTLGLDIMFVVMAIVGVFSSSVDVLAFKPDWPYLLVRVAAMAGAVGLAIGLIRRGRRLRASCVRCGRTAAQRRDHLALGKLLAWFSLLPTGAYAALKTHWALGGTFALSDPSIFDGVTFWSPGFGDTVVMSALGSVMIMAMAYRWPRLPRLMLILPASAGIAMLVPLGIIGSGFAALQAIRGTVIDEALAWWLGLAVYPPFLVWGLCLLAVTVIFARATSQPCSSCGQG
ncbi:hypothetical protein [Natronoglycomyces albus]|uniref:Uncharacterized protein n=1 Tax=Natronoglycomyces albus TaxID=2811108 RepID=A0A895XSW6_9ACTN|nr:hypothetical protein [Natronoglycomyces albus]QSB06345.1 hypothetical protein JQS30_05395 [Natronoglycomyces albus]